MIRRGLAFVLIGLVVILGQLAVSHIHGLSDPDSAHTIGDYVLLAQARTGFAAAAILLVLCSWLPCGGHASSPLSAPFISSPLFIV